MIVEDIVALPLGPAAAADGPEKARPRDAESLDREYKSGALPKEESSTIARMRRATEHFERRQWAEGLVLVDEILSEATSPEYRRRRLLEAARRRRELDKKIEDLERTSNEQAAGGAVAGGPPNALEGVEADDVRTPTVEVYSQDSILFRRTPAALLEQLIELPEEGREVYLRTYEAPAKNALNAALDEPFESSYASLRRVAERYALTPSGRAAWVELAGRLADAGRHVEAASALETRLGLPFDDDDGDDDGRAPATRHDTLAHAAMLHLLSGHVDIARRYLAEIADVHSEETILIRGEAVLGTDVPDHALFRALVEIAQARSSLPSQWPAPLGAYDHSHASTSADDLPAIGTTARWVYRLRDIPRPSKGQPAASVYRGRNLALQLVSDDERIFVRQGNAIVGIDAKTGRRAWVSRVDDRAAFASASSNMSFVGGATSNGYEDYNDLGGKSLTFVRVGASAEGSSTGDDRGVIFAIDHSTQARTSRGGQVEYQPNRLLAIDAKTGKLIWRLGASENRRDPSFGLAFTAPPTPSGATLVVPAIRESGFYLAGVTTDGKLAWLTRLYSFNATYYQRFGSGLVGGSAVAVADGVAVSAPGNGFVSAIDTQSGRLLWMTRYRSRVRENRSSSGFFFHPQPMIARTDDGPVVVVAPPDSDFVTAIDRRSGGIRWEENSGTSGVAILGCDDGHVYLSGSSLIARSLSDGREVWSADLDGRSLGTAHGTGFLAAGRLYVPRSGNQLATIDARSGKLLELYAIRDPKVPEGFAHNLFPIGGQLLALGAWGIASIEPQAESWAALQEDPQQRGFERAQLLRSEGKHEEALALLYDLLPKARSRSLSGELRGEIIATVRVLTDREKDPSPIERLLAFGRTGGETFVGADGEPLAPLVPKRAEVLRWRLLEAKLLWRVDRRRSVEKYIALLLEDGYRARCPEDNQVDVRIYASDVLREIRYSPVEFDQRWNPLRLEKNSESDEEHEARRAAERREREKELEAISTFVEEALTGEDARAARALESSVSGADESRDVMTELFKIATRRSHAKRAAEASAELAVRSWAKNSPADARNHLSRLLGDYPKLRKVEEIGSEIEVLEVSPEAVPVLRGLEFAELAAARERLAKARKASAEKQADEKRDADADEDAAGAQPRFVSPWRQVFWHEVERGILAAGAPGADPLPVLLTLRGNALCAVDIDGQVLMERELLDFPDLEEVKTRLQSHIEEPATCHLQGRRLVFFTAAGTYAFDVGVTRGDGSESGVEPGGAPPPTLVDFDARQFRLAWAQTYEHGLSKYVQRMSRIGFFGSMRLPTNQNLFPVVEFTTDGDPTLLHPNGELLRIDRRSGKLVWRFESESASVIGRPRRHGHWLEVQSISPAGLLRYRPPRSDSGLGKRSTFLPGPANTRDTAIVDGIANIFQAKELEVRAAKTERVLWSRSTSSRLVYATPSEVWTTSSGSIKSRALRSGRALRSINLPDSTTVQKQFTDPDIDGEGRTFVCSAVTSSPRGTTAYYGATYQTGNKLWLVRLGADGQVAWKTRLARGNVTYDGSRFVLEDGSWLFAFNEQDPESEKWYTRVLRVNPTTGASESWIGIEISGKGTGQPPRLCPVAGGLAVGNSEGYGWFTTSLPPIDEDPKAGEGPQAAEDDGTTGTGNTEKGSDA